jgi:high-affinity iron transporter
VLLALDSVWDTSWLLSESTLFGQLMHTLIGYSERPSTMQLVVYLGVLALMYLLMQVARTRPSERAAA